MKPKVTHEAVLTFPNNQDPEQARVIAHEIGVMLRFLSYLPGGDHHLTTVKSSIVCSGTPHLVSETLRIDARGDDMYSAIDARIDAGYTLTGPLNERGVRSTSVKDLAA